MVNLAWDAIGCVGIEPIDQDHQQMAVIVNALGDAMQSGQKERATRLAALLHDRFDVHSQRERRLFIQAAEQTDVRHHRILERLAPLRDDVLGTDSAALLDQVAQDLLQEIEDDAVLVKAMCGQALDMAERRRYLRFHVAMEVAARLSESDVKLAELIDISRGGCLLVDEPELDAKAGQEIVLEVMGELFPGILIASTELGHHVRFDGELDSHRMARILLNSIEPGSAAKEQGVG